MANDENEIKFDIALLHEPHSKYTPDEKVEVAAKYIVYGNLKRVGKEVGIPYDTLKSWKKREWWPLLVAESRKAKQDELDGSFTGIIHQAATALADRIENGNSILGKDGELHLVPMTGRDLAGVAHLMFDKRALLRGDPTSKVVRISQEEHLHRLSDKFEEIARKLSEKQVPGEVLDGEAQEE